MSYRIEYDWESKKYSKNRSNFPVSYTLAAFFAFLILVNCCWPEGWEALYCILFPGDNNTVPAALTAFTEDLRAGESLSDSAEAFCREILENASIPDTD